MYGRLLLLFVGVWIVATLWWILQGHDGLHVSQSRPSFIKSKECPDILREERDTLQRERHALLQERQYLNKEFDTLLREKGEVQTDRENDYNEYCKKKRSQTEIDFEQTNIFGNAGPQPIKLLPAVQTFVDRQTLAIKRRLDDSPRSEWQWRPRRLQFRNTERSCEVDPLSSCDWAASEAFFQFESSEPQIPPERLQKLSFLLVDQHGGPLLDTLSYLVNIGVPRQNIKRFCGEGPHCSHLDTDDELMFLHKYFFSPGLGTWERGHDNIVEIHGNMSKHNIHFDFMICLYPGFQCVMARPLATHLIVRPTNRWQEGMQDIPPRQQPTPLRLLHYAQILRKMASCGNMALSASNAYDWILWKQDLGIDALPWPSLALQEDPQIADIDKFVPPEAKTSHLLYTHLQPYFNDEYSGLVMWWLLDASSGQQDFVLDHAHYSGKKFRDYPAVLLLPYNVQVTKFVEYYMAGVPLLCPSLKLYTQWHLKYNTCFHRTTGYLPNNDYLQWNYSNYPETDGSPCCAVHSLRKADAHWWLPMADYYHWPNVTYFDSWQELRAAFQKLRNDKTYRQALIRDMLRFKKTLFERSATVVRAQLQAMVDAEERGDTCTKFGVLGV